VSVEFGHLEATKYLLGNGASINSTIKYGYTQLMMAAYNGKLETFRYLLEMGADIKHSQRQQQQ
jgi:ankyrin repeat protein